MNVTRQLMLRNNGMDENTHSFCAWVKEHKVQLLLVGISITVIAMVCFRVKDQEVIDILWKKLKERISAKRGIMPEGDLLPEVSNVPIELDSVQSAYTRPCLPFEVHQHIRNLPEGRHHSMEKAMEAANLGIPLHPDQTIVDSYTKYSQAA